MLDYVNDYIYDYVNDYIFDFVNFDNDFVNNIYLLNYFYSFLLNILNILNIKYLIDGFIIKISAKILKRFLFFLGFCIFLL